ncbi:Kiwa anti-phage protein KwaB-like domain-containing protein [Pseudomonas sp. H9]|uniref:Kiwa anti-phage protein KwaB-like domain-containing protein n=1 Tax=Pseudomonas sp. H9 TaxID=483968 RepID=UPI001057DBA5|nr:Kiwa anti-phage protein KwaB-like domain-containing protein [Pseudomonas sp. H9]TDF80245.1 DUF4868 domain-containing protein [Pseudomonas sp. H9]
MAVLQDLHNFDLQEATVNFWIFRRYTKGTPPEPKYTGKWVSLDNDLKLALKSTAMTFKSALTETLEYGLLAENNQSSALTIPQDETHAAKFIAASHDQTPAKRVSKMEELANAEFYLVKFSSIQGNLYCLRKTDATWKTKRRAGAIHTFFKSKTLKLDEAPSFHIAKDFDMAVLEDTIFIKHKSSFESMLSHKAAHQDDFNQLLAQADFQALFTTTEVVSAYVGTNAMQLRRASAIKMKGHYLDARFMGNLRREYANFGLNIPFQADGKIVPTPESCPDIFKALLDHRLKSHFSEKIYDVQNTAETGV